MLDWQKKAQNEEQKEVAKVCPSAEELAWKPPNAGGRFKCPASGCQMVASTQGGLVQHIDSAHPKLSRTGGKILKKFQKLQFHCPENSCIYNPESERYFNTFEHLKAHYASQHWEKRHACQKCGKQFGLERDWRRHEVVCGTVFACESCSASYPSRQALLVHCRRKQHPVPATLDSTKKNAPKKNNIKDQTQQDDARAGCSTMDRYSDNSQLQTQVISPVQTVRQNTSSSCSSSSSAKKSSTAGQGQNHEVSTSSPSVNSQAWDDSGHQQTPESSPAKMSRTGAGSTSASSSKASPRPILPKGVMPSVIHVFDANGSPQTRSFICAQSSSGHNSAQIQTDISLITPLYQRLAGVGVSNGSQTSCIPTTDNSSSQPQRQAAFANMATQVSVPLIKNLNSSQISDMATQASVKLVNSSTQIACDPLGACAVRQTASMENAGIQASSDVASMGTQIDTGPPVACAAVQTSQVTDVANMATQATVFCVDNGTQLFLTPHFVQPTVNTSSQSSQAGMSVRSSTNTQGTQIFISPVLPEAAQTSTTGMQTSVSLLPNRQRCYRTIAQTQTTGDQILRSAMIKANLPVMGSSGRSSRGASRSPGRKRSVKSSEVQTNATVPQKRPRKGRNKTPPSHTAKLVSTQTSLQQTSSSVGARDLFESLASDDENLTSKQNPTLSSSADLDGDSSETDLPFSDLLASTPPPHTSTSDTSMQVDFEDFLSSYTTELGVQTQDDFLAACTADFSAQTQDDFFGVCTADFGVQTAATSFGSLLEDLESNVDYRDMINSAAFLEADSTKSQLSLTLDPDSSVRNTSMVDCATATDLLLSDTHTQTTQSSLRTPLYFSRPADSGTSLNAAVTEMYIQASQGVCMAVASASASSFTDCGTGTDLFFTSSHTQTSSQVSDIEEWDLNFHPDATPSTPVVSFNGNSAVTQSGKDRPWEPSFGNVAPCRDSSFSSESGFQQSSFTGVDFVSAKGTDIHTQTSASRNSSQTEFARDDFATGGTDMHTQTADDLLEFLMTNMETQTTEDIFSHSLDLTDIQTQTTSDVLLTPPQTSSRSISSYSGDGYDLVTAETQTSGHFFPGDCSDHDDFAHFSDMQTQTGFDILDMCSSPTTPVSSHASTSYSVTSNATDAASDMLNFSFDSL